MELGKRLIFFIFSLLFAFNCDSDSIFQRFKDIDYKEIKEVFSNIKSNFNYVDIAKKKYNNDDIVGRLFIESVDIDVPIVQSTDNNFYLDHDEYGNKNTVGSIFLDYRNNIDIDRKLLIFGHNSRTISTEFKKMEKFLSSSFFNELDNRKLLIETSNKISIYDISSVVIVTDDFQHMKLSFSQEEWKKHIDWINKSSLYSVTGLSYDDDILIMQTCFYEPDDSYLLIVAKKIKEAFH